MSGTGDQEDENQRITLRLPRDLHAKLMQAGARRTRTMNAEIVERLERSFSDTEERLLALERAISDPKSGIRALWNSMIQLGRWSMSEGGLDERVSRLEDRE